jgi:hypothetical protein
MKDLFFLYVYLDPFKEFEKPLEVKIGTETFCFAYEPFYVGKGTGAGYRHNQHISAFTNQRENNQFKVTKFKEISDNMATAAAKKLNDKPWNFKEFQNNYVVILKTFEDPKALLRFEMDLINKLGTVQDRSGTLTNKIKNAYAFDNLQSKRNFDF